MARDAEELAAQVERLRELRKQGRVTVRQIADSVEVTERQAQRWFSLKELGDPNAENLKKLATYLGTTPDYIEYGTMRRSRERPELLRRLDAEQTQLGRLEAKVDRVLFELGAATEEEARQVRETLARLEAAAESRTQTTPGRSKTPRAARKPPPS